MLSTLVFRPDRVSRADGSHAVVVTDQASGVAIVIVRQTGNITEVLLPDHEEFGTVLSMLSAVGRLPIRSPTEVQVASGRVV